MSDTQKHTQTNDVVVKTQDPDHLEHAINKTSKWVHTFEWRSQFDSTESINVTYDLSAFKAHNQVYVNNDLHFSFLKYYWNVLENINQDLLPDECMNATDSCDFTANPDCTDLGVANKIGTAFSFSTHTQTCELLGTIDNYEWSLLYDDNPAKGLVLKYTAGGYCGIDKMVCII